MREFINIVEQAIGEQVQHSREFNRTDITSNPDIRENRAFNAWFGKSKVVDDHGFPLICYHGTFDEFTEFKHKTTTRRSYGFNLLGFWFDVNPETPNYFAGYEPHLTAAGSIMPVYLKIERPLIFDSEYLWDEERDAYMAARDECRAMDDTRNTARSDGRGNMVLPNGGWFDEDAHRRLRKKKDALYRAIMNERSDGFERMMDMLPRGANSSDAEVMAFKKKVIAEGYDGICLTDTAADFGSRGHKVTDWWLAFGSSQIKSAYSSKFTDSPRIHE